MDLRLPDLAGSSSETARVRLQTCWICSSFFTHTLGRRGTKRDRRSRRPSREACQANGERARGCTMCSHECDSIAALKQTPLRVGSARDIAWKNKNLRSLRHSRELREKYSNVDLANSSWALMKSGFSVGKYRLQPSEPPVPIPYHHGIWKVAHSCKM